MKKVSGKYPFYLLLILSKSIIISNALKSNSSKKNEKGLVHESYIN